MLLTIGLTGNVQIARAVEAEVTRRLEERERERAREDAERREREEAERREREEVEAAIRDKDQEHAAHSSGELEIELRQRLEELEQKL